MKINESDVLNILKPQSSNPYEPVNVNTASASTARGVESPSDGIDLGSQSGLLAQTQQAGSSEREQRVQELRALVQSGQYHVDSVSLSSAIIRATIDGD